jgi:hypothetical protein
VSPSSVRPRRRATSSSLFRAAPRLRPASDPRRRFSRAASPARCRSTALRSSGRRKSTATAPCSCVRPLRRGMSATPENATRSRPTGRASRSWSRPRIACRSFSPRRRWSRRRTRGGAGRRPARRRRRCGRCGIWALPRARSARGSGRRSESAATRSGARSRRSSPASSSVPRATGGSGSISPRSIGRSFPKRVSRPRTSLSIRRAPGAAERSTRAIAGTERPRGG